MTRDSKLRPSPTLAMNELATQLIAQGRTIHRLGFGQSPCGPPPSVIEALRANAWRRDYPPVQGVGELRERVANFHRRRYGLELAADDVLIGPGSKELMFLLQLIYQGELLLAAPSWVSYEPQARLLNLPVTWLPTSAAEGWRLDPDVLERHCGTPSERPRMLLLNYPNNPAGTSMDESRLQEIARVAQKHRLVVLSDEIYGELHHQGGHVSIARYYPEGTIVSGGLSKWCGAGGWRLGTICVPRSLHHLLNAACSVASETYSGVSAPVQYAALTAYSCGPEVESHIAQQRRVLAAVGRWTWRTLNQAGIPTAEPDGGFYLFPDFTEAKGGDTRNSRELCRKLMMDAGVALLPGGDFGRPPFELTCRLAYVDFDGDRALERAARTPDLDESYLRTECPRMIAGIEAITNWVHRREPAGVCS